MARKPSGRRLKYVLIRIYTYEYQRGNSPLYNYDSQIAQGSDEWLSRNQLEWISDYGIPQTNRSADNHSPICRKGNLRRRCDKQGTVIASSKTIWKDSVCKNSLNTKYVVDTSSLVAETGWTGSENYQQLFARTLYSSVCNRRVTRSLFGVAA